eukprot:768100-Hanusia_phi.AAC.3
MVFNALPAMYGGSFERQPDKRSSTDRWSLVTSRLGEDAGAYLWKRGVEIFIALCIVLLLMNFFPLFSLLFGATWAAWHDILLYIVGMILEAACIASAIWILYYTDTAEKESLLRRSKNRVISMFRNSSQQEDQGQQDEHVWSDE